MVLKIHYIMREGKKEQGADEQILSEAQGGVSFWKAFGIVSLNALASPLGIVKGIQEVNNKVADENNQLIQEAIDNDSKHRMEIDREDKILKEIIFNLEE